MSQGRDQRFMDLALSLGRRGLGNVWPNPAVGCVIVQGERIVGRGWTQPGGRPHAEAMALAQAGDAAQGADVYVTLEPCSHTGKTPPCADALVNAGVSRVIAALGDPDERVAGRGFEKLRQSGIEVSIGVCAEAAALDQRGFLSRTTCGLPMLTLKIATSLDGRIATASGESQWITGARARREAHALRARHDAVLVGAGTAREDNPTLTVRDLGVQQQPVRVVASRYLNVPMPSRLSESIDQAPYWILHGPTAPTDRREKAHAHGADLIEIASSDVGGLDPAAMLAALGDRGVTRVFCEGGGELSAALLNAGLVDDLVVFQAGLALGAEGRPALGAMGIAALAEANRMTLIQTRSLGPDTMSVWRKP